MLLDCAVFLIRGSWLMPSVTHRYLEQMQCHNAAEYQVGYIPVWAWVR